MGKKRIQAIGEGIRKPKQKEKGLVKKTFLMEKRY